MRYRLYETDAAGRVVRGDDIIAQSDREALDIAHRTASSRRRELWLGEIRLAVLPAQAHAA